MIICEKKPRPIYGFVYERMLGIEAVKIYPRLHHSIY